MLDPFLPDSLGCTSNAILLFQISVRYMSNLHVPDPFRYMPNPFFADSVRHSHFQLFSCRSRPTRHVQPNPFYSFQIYSDTCPTYLPDLLNVKPTHYKSCQLHVKLTPSNLVRYKPNPFHPGPLGVMST